MTPADFVREVVIPTVEEFRDDRTSRRRAYLAAIVTFQVKDYLAKGGEKRIEDAMRAALPDGGFDVVRSVCNGAKHVTTNGSHVVAFTAGADWERPPSLAGRFMAGVSMCGDFTGGREIAHDGDQFDLYHAVAATLSTFLALYTAHLAGCNFEPYPDGR